MANFDTDLSRWTSFDPLASLGGRPLTCSKISNGGYHLASPASEVEQAFVVSLREDVVFQNSFFLQVDLVKFDPGLDQGMSLIAMVRGSEEFGQVDAYLLTYKPARNKLNIRRAFSPGSLSLLKRSTVTGEAGEKLRLVFSGNNGALEGRLYNLDDLDIPIGVVSVFDAALNSGICGIAVQDESSGKDGPVSATFDDYLGKLDGVTDVPFDPPVEIELKTGEKGFVLKYPDWAESWQLQRSSSLIGVNWISVPPTEIHRDGRMLYFQSDLLVSGQEFFRLATP